MQEWKAAQASTDFTHRNSSMEKIKGLILKHNKKKKKVYVTFFFLKCSEFSYGKNVCHKFFGPVQIIVKIYSTRASSGTSSCMAAWFCLRATTTADSQDL